MGELKIVKLHFRSTLHLGADVAGIGLEESLCLAHSDTLFSCLINNYAELHNGNPRAVDKLLVPFREGEPPFRISSAFPFEMHSQFDVTYYLPKPRIDPPQFYDDVHGQETKKEYGKAVRSAQLVQMDIFHAWLSGEEVDLDKLETQDIGRICYREIRPQHARDRLTDAASIYHTGLVHFHGGSGLYFIVELNDTTLLDWDAFQAILCQAGRNGLGGRRSHGNGVFRVNCDTISVLDPEWQELFDLHERNGFNGFVNLSLYLPDTFDGLNPVAYQLVPRRGWCYSATTPTQLKRKAVTMFGEGSVFHNEPRGQLAEVTPDEPHELAHPLYRYGIPLSLPIHILEEEDDIS